MASLNSVHLIGNVTRQPEVKIIPSSETAVCEFGIAVNRTYKGKDGNKKEEVTFLDCTVFGRGAEVFAKYVNKGDPVFLSGRLKLDTWIDKRDESKRSKVSVVVEDFQFLGRRGGGGEGQQQEQEAEASSGLPF